MPNAGEHFTAADDAALGNLGLASWVDVQCRQTHLAATDNAALWKNLGSDVCLERFGSIELGIHLATMPGQLILYMELCYPTQPNGGLTSTCVRQGIVVMQGWT